jgi:hypothetical protein
VRRLACDASFRLAVLDDNDQLLRIGRASRTVPATLRNALALRDGGCRFPGCDRPIDWTEPHHLKHWFDGGPTNLINLLLLCGFHHGLVHEGGWRLERQGDDRFTAIPPPHLVGRKAEAAARKVEAAARSA